MTTGERNHKIAEFVIFCVENLAQKTAKDPKDVYLALKNSGMIHQYIIPAYDALHTQGKEYIIADIETKMVECGVKI